MREIKFRAWDEKTRKMYKDIQCMPNFIDFIDDKFFHVMQFTGLLDKNGKDIYEGDIVKLDSWEPKIMQIAFLEGAFCLADKEGYFVGDIHYVQHGGVNQSEVIGDIYSTPELLS